MIKWVYSLVGIVLRPIYYLKVSGRERIPEGGCVVCANHTANIDAALLLIAMDTTDTVSVAKAELFDNKLIGWFLRKMGALPVRRGKRDMGAVRAAMKALKSGKKLMIFPEGTRVMDGTDVGGKTGAAMLASHANVPIVPAYITAGRKAFRQCRVIFGNAVQPLCEKGHDAYRIITDQVMAQIQSLGAEAEG